MSKRKTPTNEAKQDSGVETINPLVSIIIPTYNRPITLSESIQSVLDQSLQEFEILVINDGGEDIENIIQKKNDKRIIHIKHDQNFGLSAARNSGIKAAKGKYIAYLDDDDIFFPDHLKILISFLENNPNYWVAYSDALYSHRVVVDNKNVETKQEIKYSFDFDRGRFLMENYIPVLCMVHRKECLDKIGIFNPNLKRLEDWDLWIRMSRQYDFFHIPKVTCEVRFFEDGTTMTSKGRSPFYFAYLNMIIAYLQDIKPANYEIISTCINSYLDEIFENLNEITYYDNNSIEKIFAVSDINQVIESFTNLTIHFEQKIKIKIYIILSLLYNLKGDISNAILADTQAQLAKKEVTLADTQALLAKNEVTLADIQAQLAIKEETLADILAQLTIKEVTLADTQALLAKNEVTLADTQAQLAIKEETLADTQTQLAEEEQLKRALSTRLAKNMQTMQALTAQLSDKEQVVRTLSIQVAELDQSIQSLTAQAAEVAEEVLHFAMSKSWRFTRPFRKIMRIMRVN